MSKQGLSGLFVCEGPSDMPLAAIVETLFVERGAQMRLSTPDYSLLAKKVSKSVESRIRAGLELVGKNVDLVVIHRDADNAGPDKRRDEIFSAIGSVETDATALPVIPVRMTEAWLLLDEDAIRRVAGNPRGRVKLALPHRREVESVADPKQLLAETIIKAADCTGRRRDQVEKRFGQHRRELLQSIDLAGAIAELPSWKQLILDIERTLEVLQASNR